MKRRLSACCQGQIAEERETVMGSILDVLSQGLDADTTSRIGKLAGGSPETTGRLVSAALPLLLSALARNASRPEGAEALHQAVVRDHSGEILDNVPERLADPRVADDGAGILRHVLGDQEGAVEQGLAARTGVDPASAARVLQMVAPLVMGALGKATRGQGLDAGGLASLLGNEQQEVRQAAPDVMGLVGSLLGGDAPGGSSAESGQGKALGGLLNSLLGRR